MKKFLINLHLWTVAVWQQSTVLGEQMHNHPFALLKATAHSVTLQYKIAGGEEQTLYGMVVTPYY